MNSSGRVNGFDYEPGGCGTQALVYGIIIALILCFSGCKSIQYVPIVEHKTDTVELTRVEFDSIYAHDSIYIHEYTKGDTVYLELKKWQTKYVEKQVHDTTYVATHDTIPQPYEVEKKLSAYESMKMEYGGYAILLVLISLVFVIYSLIKKFLPRR